ncbi:hypothetical protein AVEN_259361-1 [Araneus ventricosus]|uniref:Uncharacterized protein n=1 Tax=Araneus ventricosus TaxID=182803 RepID=A0A4Y2DT53_ARAVE|nr:hypothetical protein AVEN_259361-1 [Araneus ventricosus]
MAAGYCIHTCCGAGPLITAFCSAIFAENRNRTEAASTIFRTYGRYVFSTQLLLSLYFMPLIVSPAKIGCVQRCLRSPRDCGPAPVEVKQQIRYVQFTSRKHGRGYALQSKPACLSYHHEWTTCSTTLRLTNPTCVLS